MKRRNIPYPRQLSASKLEGIDLQQDEEKYKNDKISKLRSVIKSLRQHFREYSEKSSLHGIQYIGEKGRPLLERLCWVVIFFGSLYLCMGLIMQTWEKWNTRPVIVSFAYKPTAVWRIPLPAITVCSEVKAKQTVFNFTEQLRNDNRTEKEQEILEAVSLLCDYKSYTSGSNISSEDALDILEEVAPSFEETFLMCKWFGFEIPCSMLFKKTITSEGLCYSFNMLRGSELFVENIRNQAYWFHNSSSTWTLEEGFQPVSDLNQEYPLRPMGTGNEGGIEIMLATNDRHYDYACRGPTQGFKLLLHNPTEIPAMDEKYIIIPTNQDFTMAVKPEMTQTSESLRPYPAMKRHCYFQDEKKLKFHKIYTAENCQMECIARLTAKQCNCVAFFMPYYNDTPICGSGTLQCIKETAKLSRMVEVLSKFATSDSSYEEFLALFEKCNCLPSCTTLVYNVESSQTDFDWQEYPEVLPAHINDTKGLRVSKVRIFYKDTHFIPAYRSELYGQTDFIANCGGLLGLFMGFSFISIVEIVYFLTLRICCNLTNRSRKIRAIINLRKLKDDGENSIN